MELYDTVKVKCKCPSCKEEHVTFFKTKSLDNTVQTFTPGDRISESVGDYEFLELTGVCQSSECQKNDPAGKGSTITAKIRLKDGLITNTVYDIESKVRVPE